MVFRQEKKSHNKNADHCRCRNAGNSLYGSRKKKRSRFKLFKLTVHAVFLGILLLAEQKSFNRELSRERIVIENISTKFKFFALCDPFFNTLQRKLEFPKRSNKLCLSRRGDSRFGDFVVAVCVGHQWRRTVQVE